MGTGRPRRRREQTFPLGRCVTTFIAGLFETIAERAGADRSLCAKWIWSLRYLRERSRVVRRLVSGGLLCNLTRAQSAGAEIRLPPRFSWRLLAAPHQSGALRCAFQHPSGVPIRG